MTLFTEADLAKIREAVRAAERRTRGEIVPMIVPASARYREARHFGGLILALLALTALLTIEYGWGRWGWTEHHPGWILVGVTVAYGLGAALGQTPWGIRLLTPDDRITFKVRRRAEVAFYEQGLHRTREATGILILVSLLERRVQVLADRAINERVPPGTWGSLVREMVRDLQEDRGAEGLCRAIGACGELLAAHFPVRPGDNPNELPDDLVQGR